MKDKGHFITSLVKSGARILACFLLGGMWTHGNQTGAVQAFAGIMILAEWLGVMEEFLDRR